jgi:hypothetical protein
MLVIVEKGEAIRLTVELATPAEAIQWINAARRKWVPEDAKITMRHPNGSEVVL